jgi:hypothetical protein
MRGRTSSSILRRGLIAVAATAAIAGGAIGAGLASSTAPTLQVPERTVAPVPADDAASPEPQCSYRPWVHLMVAVDNPGAPRFGGQVGTSLYRTPVCGDMTAAHVEV